jgi:glycosyltransferase involved in cell wall biosynthesis
MNILFVHQNFPGQFAHLCEALLQQGGYKLTAFTMNQYVSKNERLKVIRYQAAKASSKDAHPWSIESEAKIIRGDAALRAAIALNNEGYKPDVIYAHPGWGECLFLKNVWPHAKVILYCEFYYHTSGADVGFDPEFPCDIDQLCKVQLKNANNLLNIELADAGIAPTEWQKSTYPEPFRSKITVVHEGVDTAAIKPSDSVQIEINGKPLSPEDEVITFVNRTLEPYRGYHIFMRALPEILSRRPKARVIIIGSEGASYGPQAPNNETWRAIFYKEVQSKLDNHRVHFLGALQYDDYLKVLKRSNVHVYLTYPFVLSWSLMEAMSTGCLVIASDTKPVREVVKHGGNGLLVDFFDVSGLAKSIVDVLEQPKQYEHLRVSARQSIIKNYDLHKVCLPKQVEFINNYAPSNLIR